MASKPVLALRPLLSPPLVATRLSSEPESPQRRDAAGGFQNCALWHQLQRNNPPEATILQRTNEWTPGLPSDKQRPPTILSRVRQKAVARRPDRQRLAPQENPVVTIKRRTTPSETKLLRHRGGLYKQTPNRTEPSRSRPKGHTRGKPPTTLLPPRPGARPEPDRIKLAATAPENGNKNQPQNQQKSETLMANHPR